jgi:hypothetical protein
MENLTHKPKAGSSNLPLGTNKKTRKSAGFYVIFGEKHGFLQYIFSPSM